MRMHAERAVVAADRQRRDERASQVLVAPDALQDRDDRIGRHVVVARQARPVMRPANRPARSAASVSRTASPGDGRSRPDRAAPIAFRNISRKVLTVARSSRRAPTAAPTDVWRWFVSPQMSPAS